LNRQLRLPLQQPTSFRRDDLVVSGVNARAVAALDEWPGWHGGVLALSGPAGVGKSHLASIWAQAVGAVALTSTTTLAELEALHGRPVLAEDADAFPDEILFHLINMAGEPGGGLLLTARKPPALWSAELPDLRSRLNATHVAEIDPPDDEVLLGVLQKFFRERNIRPSEEVTAYLVRRIERSVPAARGVVARIDEVADQTQRPVTRALAREVLDQSDDLFGDSLVGAPAMGDKPDR
jgi:chromosomal replication initiation ATPase DnaA